MCHRTLLVALQLVLPRVVGEVGGMLSVHITIGQGDSGEVIVVGMTIPVHIQGEHIGCVHSPLATYSGRSVVVAQIIRLHIHPRMLAAGSIDAFAVDGTVSIQFQILVDGVGEVLCHLPVGVAVRGLVA